MYTFWLAAICCDLFSVVDKAYKLLLEPEQKKRAVDVIQAGKEYVEHMVSGICLGWTADRFHEFVVSIRLHDIIRPEQVKQKKKQLKKDGKPQDVEEDDPDMVSRILRGTIRSTDLLFFVL